jgi:hypothetical protein
VMSEMNLFSLSIVAVDLGAGNGFLVYLLTSVLNQSYSFLNKKTEKKNNERVMWYCILLCVCICVYLYIKGRALRKRDRYSKTKDLGKVSECDAPRRTHSTRNLLCRRGLDHCQSFWYHSDLQNCIVVVVVVFVIIIIIDKFKKRNIN